MRRKCSVGLGYVVALLIVGTAPAAQVTTTFEAPTYVGGALSGQVGWLTALSSGGTANVITGDNGPTIPGNQCVELNDAAGEIRLRVALPGDLVTLGGPLVTLQYDLRYLTNRSASSHSWGHHSYVSSQLLDAQVYHPPVGNMQWDGGLGGSCGAWIGVEPDGDPADWCSNNDPIWTDDAWHTIAWTFDYGARQFLSVTFDGITYPRAGAWFVDWNGQGGPGGVANTADMIDLYIGGYGSDGLDIWRIDNYVLTAIAPTTCPGDANCDGTVRFSDIDYFVAGIPDNPYAWEALYMYRTGGTPPPCDFANCDINGDGHVNFADIDPFVALIPSTCP